MTDWSASDIHYLQEHARHYKMERLTRRLGRSIPAVEQKCKDLGISRVSNDGGYTRLQLRQGFRCSYDKLDTWAARGWLVGSRQGPDSRVYNFSDEAVVAFVQQHYDELNDLAKESLWIQGIVREKDQRFVRHVS